MSISASQAAKEAFLLLAPSIWCWAAETITSLIASARLQLPDVPLLVSAWLSPQQPSLLLPLLPASAALQSHLPLTTEQG